MITAIVLAKNEEKNIATCLHALSFCDAVVVVDDFSTDNTAKIAKKMGATVFQHALNGDFAAQHNWVLSQIKSHWVLFVDADEYVSGALAREIKSAIEKIEYKGFYIRRVDKLWKKVLRHGDVGNAKVLRLARPGAGKWVGRVHEKWQIEGKVGELSNHLEHTPHPTLVEFLHHINDYSTIRAQEFFDAGRKTSLFEIVCGPVWRFFQAYILKLGFLDGTAGFIHAMVMALYMFLVAGKLYLLYKGIPNA